MGIVVSLRNVFKFNLKEDQNEVAAGFTEFRRLQIDSVTTRPKREKLGCWCADCLLTEQHYQRPDSLSRSNGLLCLQFMLKTCDLPDHRREEVQGKYSTICLCFC